MPSHSCLHAGSRCSVHLQSYDSIHLSLQSFTFHTVLGQPVVTFVGHKLLVKFQCSSGFYCYAEWQNHYESDAPAVQTLRIRVWEISELPVRVSGLNFDYIRIEFVRILTSQNDSCFTILKQGIGCILHVQYVFREKPLSIQRLYVFKSCKCCGEPQ